MNPVYLDCAATCPVDPEVADVVMKHMVEGFGNPSSRHHDYGFRANGAVNVARRVIAETANSNSDEVVFLSGATEANNLAILGLVSEAQRMKRNHILATQIEHPSVLAPLHKLEQLGFQVEYAPPSEGGSVDPLWFKEHLRDSTFLVSVMHVNNETGTIQPIPEIGAILGDHIAYFHVDATQSFGKLEPPDTDRIDLLACSAHKLCGPKGVGALIVRRRRGTVVPLEPRVFGGGQEWGLRSGTPAVPLIAGFAKAVELCARNLRDDFAAAERTKSKLLKALEPVGVQVNGQLHNSSPYIVNVSIDNIDSEALLIATKDIAAFSNGSACAANSVEPSHVLMSMKLPRQRVDSAVRFSWSRLTPTFEFNTLANRIRTLL